ncbi:bifunctional metallophosphatase/5'-nucleotidase [Georgenia sp. SUBG003]|uniref:bifunctional metallophosphatase/5'-nucleotidase n=1 Tax=Georgenia sp. SUBG003 TaxID=1497974 RepID=UPI000693980A
MRRTVVLTGTALAGLALLASSATAAPPVSGSRPGDVEVQLLAINDYHGHLEPGLPGSVGSSPAGGSEYLATHLQRLREGHRNSVTVAAGDLIGGSPFLSGLFHDEPSVESLNAMDLDIAGVGNHEFDEGVSELLRMQYGGCHADGCYFEDQPYPGADFQWLAANVKNAQDETPLPPYEIRKFQGASVAFIGMTLEGTAPLVAQSGIEGWRFDDEVETANALVPELRSQGVEAMVVLLHEGGAQTGTFDQCVGISGPVVEIAEALDPAIDAVITGHTHQAYNCEIDDPAGQPRRVTSAYSFGRVISEINLTIDRTTKDVRRDAVTAINHVVTQDVARDAEQTAILDRWSELADVVGDREVGTIAADIARQYEAGGSDNRGAESDAYNMVADAQLWATRDNGAQIALMNPGGVRSDLLYASSARGEGDGVVTYREAFTMQPFGNLLSTIPMTGDQVRRVLEQQCQSRYLHLGVSEGFTYDVSRELDGRICTPGSIEVTNMRLGGVPIDTDATYMVTVNNFLADGGDSFTVFREIPASERIGAGEDLDALIAYLGAHPDLAPPGTDRVNELVPVAG